MGGTLSRRPSVINSDPFARKVPEQSVNVQDVPPPFPNVLLLSSVRTVLPHFPAVGPSSEQTFWQAAASQIGWQKQVLMK